jgi:hypothetical protein
MMNELAAKLFRAGYKLVIGTDSDEFLVTDPATGKTLSQYLSDTEIKTTLSGLGLDIGQHLNMEYELNPKLSLLSQREYALLSTRFTKTSIITRGKKWGSGFHSIKGTNFHIDPNLYLLHFGSVDYEQIRQKMKSRDKSWGKHTMRRAENIILITNKKPRDFDITTSRARKLQKWLRPIYAWNKPAMFGLKWTVQLPERFLSALRNKIYYFLFILYCGFIRGVIKHSNFIKFR